MMINNLPTYAQDYDYVVAIECNDELWFYGAYSTKSEAMQVAAEIDGIITHNARC